MAILIHKQSATMYARPFGAWPFDIAALGYITYI